MLISLCGKEEDTKNFIKFLKDLYGEKIVVCDYFRFSFNTIIDTEEFRYKLFDKCNYSEKIEKIYNNYVDEIVNERIIIKKK